MGITNKTEHLSKTKIPKLPMAWKWKCNICLLAVCIFIKPMCSSSDTRDTANYCTPMSFVPERELVMCPHSRAEGKQKTNDGIGFPKVYIYTLPEQFNKDIRDCISPEPKHFTCFRLENGGFGELMYREGELGVYNTHQFALEVIIHHQLLNSKYRTLSPDDADVFYIPAYMGSLSSCYTGNDQKDVITYQNELFNIIKSMPYFEQGRPHLSSLSRVEREMVHSEFPCLTVPDCRNVTYLAIEKETNNSIRKRFGLENQRIIVAPYPSYVHRKSSVASSQSVASPDVESRRIAVFLAASFYLKNPLRGIILKQFGQQVEGLSYEEYSSQNGGNPRPHVFFETPTCLHSQVNTTINWMQHSVFCLQPHGDTPTRKSFYDSIQAGCIPVIFKFPREHVVYPFERVLNYTEFMVTIPSERITSGESIFEILDAIASDDVRRLHNNVLRYARLLQYSVIEEKSEQKFVDALDMIMDEVRFVFGL